LLKHFDKVDLVEQNAKFLDQARAGYLAGMAERVDQWINVGLQDFNPEADRYGAIWIQWVLNYLKDEDLVALLERCKRGIKINGMIFVKENISSVYTPDEDDSSATRTDEQFVELFQRAGLEILKTQFQPEFPKELFKVKLYALRF